jgi:hypothetical protein
MKEIAKLSTVTSYEHVRNLQQSIDIAGISEKLFSKAFTVPA